MNLFCKDHKSTTQTYRKHYDQISWNLLADREYWGYLDVHNIMHCHLVDNPHLYNRFKTIDEAVESSSVIRVYGPFEAKSRGEALRILHKKFRKMSCQNGISGNARSVNAN